MSGPAWRRGRAEWSRASVRISFHLRSEPFTVAESPTQPPAHPSVHPAIPPALPPPVSPGAPFRNRGANGAHFHIIVSNFGPVDLPSHPHPDKGAAMAAGSICTLKHRPSEWGHIQRYAKAPGFRETSVHRQGQVFCIKVGQRL